MILPGDFVTHLRTDAVALNMLAHMEHSYIPDEMYFAIGKSLETKKRIL